MSAGRVTIMCEGLGGSPRSACGNPAVELHWVDRTNDGGENWQARVCSTHAERSREMDDFDRHVGLNYKVGYSTIANPGTCSDADIANVRAAIEAIARLCRALWCDDAESREDRDVLELCAQEVRGEWYEPCEAWGWNFEGGERHIVDHGPDGGETRCPVCHGIGLVLRRDRRAA